MFHKAVPFRSKCEICGAKHADDLVTRRAKWLSCLPDERWRIVRVQRLACSYRPAQGGSSRHHGWAFRAAAARANCRTHVPPGIPRSGRYLSTRSLNHDSEPLADAWRTSCERCRVKGFWHAAAPAAAPLIGTPRPRIMTDRLQTRSRPLHRRGVRIHHRARRRDGTFRIVWVRNL